ncbi:lysophospholipid acyltransferase family protein [uncultured Lutibacter sp.]|uniref:lysophospholipid acyltransferase family protein n=1 Tax=uncultured Lutibacter sp. TaxID=437739 RepID=UPI0026098AB3|nr:lysophospholipid acyltransferase family protein [uncultured Lutibacter sp.]
MKNLWYNIMRAYLKVGLYFLHKKISVFGQENIPKNGAVLFIGNHQNALIDAILIPITTSRNIHFLTRASAFKKGFIEKFLKSLNMIPVYRIRDGIRTIEKNIYSFEQCFEILNEEGAVEIFAEGNHDLKRQIRPLKKGFARIILGTLQKYPDLEIQIVPVGFNYDSHLNFPSSVSIHYGKPILANDFIDTKNPDVRFSKIINKVSLALKELTLNIEDSNNYDKIIAKLNALKVNYTNLDEVNKMVENIELDTFEIISKKRNFNWFTPIHLIAKLNSIFPLLIWKYLKPSISDIVFTNTFRFALITTLFPLFYLIQTAIVYYFFNLKYALIYLVSCILLGVISTKTITINL